MAEVTLTETFINLASDPAQYVKVRRLTGSQGGRTRSATGEVRQYAGGRRRAVRQEGSPTAIPATFRVSSLDAVDLLASWAGQPVWVRDPRGRREACVYFDVEESDTAPGLTDVTLSLVGVTVDETV